MNTCSLVGTVLRSPTVRFEGDGYQVCAFTLAVSEHSYGPERKDYQLFVPCVSWGKSAEACSTLQAQDMVAITGRLGWQDRKQKCGQTHSGLVVKVQTCTVLEPALAVPA